VLPMRRAMTSTSIVTDYLAALLGARAAQGISILILWTAFASIFSLMLGYSRILYAAARDGNFFRLFGRLHATEAHPYVATLFLGGVATAFCFIPLGTVLQAILSIRAIIPFMAQIAGAVIIRRREPDRPRPFRMWLYPLPAIVALGLWSYIVVSPQNPTLFVSNVQQMTATGSFSDSSQRDVTGSAKWASSDPKTAPVTSGGSVTCVLIGHATITATQGNVQGSSTVTCTSQLG